MRLITILSVLLFLSACQTIKPHSEPMTSWIGSSTSDLTAQLGQPALIDKSGNGSAIYVYSIRVNSRYPSPNSSGTIYYGRPGFNTGAAVPNITVTRCNMRFTVDQNNRIVSAVSAGSNCYLYQKKS